MAEEMRATISSMLHGIDRYNPQNIATLEHYVQLQSKENTYDLEANLALLKLYQFTPTRYTPNIACQVLLKALTNLPHTDFILCKCLLGQEHMEDADVKRILYLHDLLEMCQINTFWKDLETYKDVLSNIKDFSDSIRKYICHVISTTYQVIDKAELMNLLGRIEDPVLQGWLTKYGWKDNQNGTVTIGNQEEIVKTKNITEKIDFDAVAGIMAACR